MKNHLDWLWIRNYKRNPIAQFFVVVVGVVVVVEYCHVSCWEWRSTWIWQTSILANNHHRIVVVVVLMLKLMIAAKTGGDMDDDHDPYRKRM